MIRRPLSLNQIRMQQAMSGPHVNRIDVLEFARIVRVIEAAHGITNEAADKAEAREKTALRAAGMAAEEAADKIRGANTRVVELTVHVSTAQARAAVVEALKETRTALGVVGLGLVLAAAYAARAGDDSGGERVQAVNSAARALLRDLEAASLADPGETRVGETIIAACDALRELLEVTK